MNLSCLPITFRMLWHASVAGIWDENNASHKWNVWIVNLASLFASLLELNYFSENTPCQWLKPANGAATPWRRYFLLALLRRRSRYSICSQRDLAIGSVIHFSPIQSEWFCCLIISLIRKWILSGFVWYSKIHSNFVLHLVFIDLESFLIYSDHSCDILLHSHWMAIQVKYSLFMKCSFFYCIQLDMEKSMSFDGYRICGHTIWNLLWPHEPESLILYKEKMERQWQLQLTWKLNIDRIIGKCVYNSINSHGHIWKPVWTCCCLCIGNKYVYSKTPDIRNIFGRWSHILSTLYYIIINDHTNNIWCTKNTHKTSLLILFRGLLLSPSIPNTNIYAEISHLSAVLLLPSPTIFDVVTEKCSNPWYLLTVYWSLWLVGFSG